MERTRRFTNRQVVAMVVAISAAVGLAPVAAIATTSSLVSITDPVSSSHRARVNAAGRLYTAPCDSDSCASVDGNSLRVGGTVNSQAVAPSSAWRAMSFVNGPTVLTGPTASAIDVTSLTVTPAGSDANFGLQAYSVPATATTCSAASGTLLYYLSHLAGNVAFTASFPTPLRAVPTSGTKLCLYGVTGVGGTLWVNASGFLG